MENDLRYNRDGPDTTLTAASLIDAIITHQINQPCPNDRQSPALSRSDRLFASFQRPSQATISQVPSHQINPPSMQINIHVDEKPEVDIRGMNHKNSQGKLK
jgi:hypothetical protein